MTDATSEYIQESRLQRGRCPSTSGIHCDSRFYSTRSVGNHMEALGIYEVSPEDFALAEFVDSSKLELQRIVREGLDMLRKENS